MERTRRMLCAIALAVLLVSPALVAAAPDTDVKPAEPAKADTPAKADAPAKTDAKTPELDEDSALLAKEAKLSDEQKVKLAETVAAAKASMAAWQTANKAKIDAFNKALADAREAQDRAAFQKAVDEAKPMLEESRALQHKHYKATMDILTVEQKSAWVGYILWNDMTTQCKPLNLTAEQTAKARTLCDSAGKELVALPETDKPTEEDTKARQAIQKKLFNGLVDGILTEEQRTTMKTLSGEGPGAAPAK